MQKWIAVILGLVLLVGNATPSQGQDDQRLYPVSFWGGAVAVELPDGWQVSTQLSGLGTFVLGDSQAAVDGFLASFGGAFSSNNPNTLPTRGAYGLIVVQALSPGQGLEEVIRTRYDLFSLDDEMPEFETIEDAPFPGLHFEGKVSRTERRTVYLHLSSFAAEDVALTFEFVAYDPRKPDTEVFERIISSLALDLAAVRAVFSGGAGADPGFDDLAATVPLEIILSDREDIVQMTVPAGWLGGSLLRLGQGLTLNFIDSEQTNRALEQGGAALEQEIGAHYGNITILPRSTLAPGEIPDLVANLGFEDEDALEMIDINGWSAARYTFTDPLTLPGVEVYTVQTAIFLADDIIVVLTLNRIGLDNLVLAERMAETLVVDTAAATEALGISSDSTE